MRGEYPSTISRTLWMTELPPRARRIRMRKLCFITQQGTTSACAENTRRPGRCPPWWWNYLRVRGEYAPQCRWKRHDQELPPRARRILRIEWKITIEDGTTSACAENTLWGITTDSPCGNYLRVRGEYDRIGVTATSSPELPPRARRIPTYIHEDFDAIGTTSACAENTLNELGLL